MKDLSSHIMDIVQNSIRAKASRIEINVDESLSKNTLIVSINDNGCGMSKGTLQKVTDPFFTSRDVRKVGLGIPLFKQNAERTGGLFKITSEIERGTSIYALFYLNHWDCLPLGDIGGTVAMLVSTSPEIHFIYTHTIESDTYILDSEEVKNTLDGVPVNDPEIALALIEMLRNEINELRTSTIND